MCVVVVVKSHSSIPVIELHHGGALVILEAPQAFAPCIESPEKDSRFGGLLRLNSLGSIYCDALCFVLSLCLSLLLSLLRPPGPDRVHCSLHGNCIMLHLCVSVSLCCWVPQVHCAAAPSSHVFMHCLSTAPSPPHLFNTPQSRNSLVVL